MSATVYFVRHGEVEHHRQDVSITTRGREQAASAGDALAARIADGDAVAVYHSPVTRVQETAEIIHARLQARREASLFSLSAPQPDELLANVRFPFRSDGVDRFEEPSLLYEQIFHNAAYQKSLPATWVNFYQGFWSSADPMGYWLSHDSDGGAETPDLVLSRLQTRLTEILRADETAPARAHWIMVTHSGAMRILLRHAFGADPGEPDFCEIIVVELGGQGGPLLTYRGRSAPLSLIAEGG